MSNNPGDIPNDVGGGKKRKRKRNNKKNAHQVETSVIEEPIAARKDVQINRSNKKMKFEDGDSSEKKGQPEPIVQDIESKTVDEDTAKSELEVTEDPVVDEASTKNDEERRKTNDKRKKDKKGKKSAKVTYFADEDDEEDDDDFESSRSYTLGSHVSRHLLAQRAAELNEVRQKLPISQSKDLILDYISRNQVTVIIGETGSGKSTQIPQFSMPLNKKQIAVTQPRRVAAASLATRVSEEYGCPLGQEVGYQVRFSNVTDSRKTKLKYLTDGMLLREIMLDEKLMKYSTIIIDEAHERTILTDLIMGFLKEMIVTKKRTDLKIIIMSATLNAELFSKFFDHAPILFIEGKMYPVSKHYLGDSSEDIVDTMVRSVVQVNMGEQEGDILCFLPGQEEIDNCVNILQTIAPQLPKEAPAIIPLPLYAALSPAQQLKIFEKVKGRKRKVILATNIAETSITVSGVKYVIDSGLRKVKVWKHQLGLSTLLTTSISQASAKQRAGRAGRESVGKVFRLYSEDVFLKALPKQQESEIMRNDIILPILTLKKIGVDDLLNWTWIEHPGQEAILSALNTLYTLGALNDSGKITPLGYKMAVLPLPPQLSVVLISALEMGVLAPVIDIVSCLSVDNLVLNVFSGNGELRDEVNFKRRQYCPLGTKLGDLIALKEYFNYFNELYKSKKIPELKAWCKDMFFSFKGFKNVFRVRNQLKEYMVSTIKQDDSLSQNQRETQLKNLKGQLEADDMNIESDTDDEESNDDFGKALKKPLDVAEILKSFLKGYITNTAIGMPDRSFRTCTNGQLISIHPSSNLFGKANLDAIMYIEYVYTAKAYGRSCSAVELTWLQEIAPHLLGGAKVNVNDT